MVEEDKTSRDVAEFNMAISYLNRLNQWFYLAGESSLKLDSFNWFHALMLLFRELSTEMREKEIDDMNKQIIKLNMKVVRNQMDCMRSKKIMIPPDLWKELHNLELSLRKIMKESGLQMKMKKDIDETPDDW